MKKIIVFSLVIIATITTTFLFTSTIGENNIKKEKLKPTFDNPNRIYDVNRDGIIDYKDACETLSYINHKPSFFEKIVYLKLTDARKKLYDVNIDSIVNTIDVEEIWANIDE